MKIVGLKLTDFRQFRGESFIDFATASAKRVTVIHGENGVGKTTILNAIYWCLYGRVLEEFEDPDRLVNDGVAASASNPEARVELQFEHAGSSYRIERVYRRDERKSVVQGFRLDNGNNIPVMGVDAVVNRIIPVTMAPYFFFHGEGLTSLTARGQNAFREAVRAILGFNHADHAIDLLQRIRIKWQKEYAKLNKLDEAAQHALREEAEAGEAILEADKKLLTVQENLQHVERALQSINEELATIKVHDIDKFVEQRNKLELRQRTIPREISKLRERKLKLVQRHGWAIFGYSMVKKASGVLERFRVERKLPAEYNDRFINDLLKEGTCICGLRFEEHAGAEERIRSLLAGASTSEQEDALVKAASLAENARDVSEEFIAELMGIDSNIQRLDLEKAQNTRKLEELDNKIASIDQERKNELETERRDLSRVAESLREQRTVAKAELNNSKNKLEAAKRRKKDVIGGERLDLFHSQLGVIERVIEMMEQITRTEERNAVQEVEQLINERLDKYSRKDFYADVGEDFSFTLKKQDGTTVAKSKGERMLLNIAFISSLIKLAKRHAEKENKYFVQGTVAPFVIDAPFGELDNEYRAAVAEFLPESTDQLIVLLSSSHWGSVVEQHLRPSIGKEYMLVAEHARPGTDSSPRDELEIEGQVYVGSRYDAEFDRTVVEQVGL